MYVCMYIYVYIYMYIFIYVFTHICVCISIHICMYTFFVGCVFPWFFGEGPRIWNSCKPIRTLSENHYKRGAHLLQKV